MPKLFRSTIDGFEVILPDDVVGDPVKQREFVLQARAQAGQLLPNQITDLPMDTPLPASAEYAAGSAPVITSGQPELGQTMTGSRNATMRNNAYSTPPARINPADTRDATAFEEGFNYSLMNPVVGTGQRIREMLDRTPIPSPSFLPTQEQVTARRERYENSGLSRMPGAATGRFLGGMVSSAPLLAATRNPNVLIGAGLFGGVQPTTEGESPLLNAAIGTATGGGGLMLGNALSRVVRGGGSPRAQMLRDEGIDLTPGQASGPSASMIEESMVIPFSGITEARNRAVEQFNTAAINRALQPINETLDEGVEVGVKSIDNALTKVGAVYDDAYENIGNFTLDEPFGDAYQRILGELQEAGLKDAVSAFKGAVADRITRNIRNIKTEFAGQAWKETQKRFRDLGRELIGTNQPLAIAYSQMALEMGEMVARQAPEVSDQLQNANQAYRMLIPIKNASLTAGSAAREGVFTPNVLNTAIKNNNRNAFARGSAPMQDFAQAGVQVLGDRVSDSRTALRTVGQTLPSLLAGGGIFTGQAIPVLSGILGTRAAYTPTGTRALNTLLNRRPDAVRGFQLNPVLSGATGVATGQGLFGR